MELAEKIYGRSIRIRVMQSSEKAYKVAEEVVKALAEKYNTHSRISAIIKRREMVYLLIGQSF
jgi:hypothetical protein